MLCRNIPKEKSEILRKIWAARDNRDWQSEANDSGECNQSNNQNNNTITHTSNAEIINASSGVKSQVTVSTNYNAIDVTDTNIQASNCTESDQSINVVKEKKGKYYVAAVVSSTIKVFFVDSGVMKI